MRNRRTRILRLLLIVPIAVVVFGFIFGQVTLQLWNWLMPTIFGLPTLTFWQALGLLFLSWILFGGRRGFSGPGRHMRHRMRERWEQMTPEQREELRKGMADRWGRRCGPQGVEPESPSAV